MLSVLVLVVEQETAACSPSLLLMMSTAAKKEARFILARLRCGADLLAICAIENEPTTMIATLHTLSAVIDHLRQATVTTWEERLALHLNGVILIIAEIWAVEPTLQVLERGGLVSPLLSNELVEGPGDRGWISYGHRQTPHLHRIGPVQ